MMAYGESANKTFLGVLALGEVPLPGRGVEGENADFRWVALRLGVPVLLLRLRLGVGEWPDRVREPFGE